MRLNESLLKKLIREEIQLLYEVVKINDEFFFKHNHPNKTLAGRIGIVKKIKDDLVYLHMIDNTDTQKNWLPVPKKFLVDKHTKKKS